jgi:hypothetical protein
VGSDPQIRHRVTCDGARTVEELAVLVFIVTMVDGIGCDFVDDQAGLKRPQEGLLEWDRFVPERSGKVCCGALPLWSGKR